MIGFVVGLVLLVSALVVLVVIAARALWEALG